MCAALNIDFDIRKTLHVKLLSDTHAGLKIQACKYKLSMQSIMDELALRVVQGDPYILGVLEELSRSKRERAIRALADTDAETLLDYIEDDRRINER